MLFHTSLKNVIEDREETGHQILPIAERFNSQLINSDFPFMILGKSKCAR